MRFLSLIRRQRERHVDNGSFNETPLPAPASAEPSSCTGTTRKGAPCKLPPVPGSDRCLLHPPAPAGPAAA